MSIEQIENMVPDHYDFKIWGEEEKSAKKTDKGMPCYKRELKKQWACQELGDDGKPQLILQSQVSIPREETRRQRCPRRWCVGWDTWEVVREAGLGRGRREASNEVARKASATLSRNSGAEGGHSDIILNWNKAFVVWHRLVTGWSPRKMLHAIP